MDFCNWLSFQYVLSFRGQKNASFDPLFSISSQLSAFARLIDILPTCILWVKRPGKSHHQSLPDPPRRARQRGLE
jgi:hypothetical protein